MTETTLQDAWLTYCKVHGMDSMNRNTYTIFKAGWNAALAAMVAPKVDEWRLNLPEDQA